MVGRARCGDLLRRRLGVALVALVLLAGGGWAQATGWQGRVEALAAAMRENDATPDTLSRARALVSDLVLETSAEFPDPEACNALYSLSLGLMTLDIDDQRLPWREMLSAARDAQLRIGEQDRALRVATVLATRCLERGEVSEATRELESALAATPKALWNRPAARHVLAEAARLTWDWTAALAMTDVMAAELDAVPVTPGEAWSEEWQRYAVGLRAAMHGTRAQCYLELGLVVAAGRELELEHEYAVASGDAGRWVAYVVHELELSAVVEDYRSVLTRLDEVDGFDPVVADDSSGVEALLAVHYGLAQLELERRDPKRERRGLGTLSRAVGSADLDPPTRITAQRAMADALRRRGELDRAAEILRSARTSLDALDSRDGSLAAHHATLAAAEWRLAAAQGQTSPGASVRLRGAFERYLEVWARVDRPPGGIGFLQLRERCGVLEALLSAVNASQDAEHAFVELLRVQALGSARDRAQVPDPAWLRENLLASEEHGVLVLLPGVDHVTFVAFDRNGVELARSGDVVSIDARLDRWMEALDRLTSRLTRPEGHAELAAYVARLGEQASSALLPARILERLSKWSAVSVVCAVWGDLPIEALTLPDGRLLGEALAVDVLPSLPLGGELASRADSRDREPSLDLFVAGTLDPALEVRERFGDLASHDLRRADLAPVLEHYPTRRTKYVSAKDSTSRILTSDELRAASVVQLLLHGVYDPSRRRGASLAFAADPSAPALVSCADVEELDVAGLVVLSACGTARGPARPGDDELANLGGAFLRAGADAVVLSRGDLELASTLRSLDVFHGALRAGASPAEALRRARVAAAEHSAIDRWRAARLQVVGLGQRSIFR